MLFGWVFGAIALFFMWLPTELMSSFVTPAVLAQISLAYAVGVTNKAVRRSRSPILAVPGCMWRRVDGGSAAVHCVFGRCSLI